MALQSIRHYHSTPAPFANPAKSAAPAKASSKAQTTANHFSVNYLSGIIRIRQIKTKKTHCDAKGLATRQESALVCVPTSHTSASEGN